MKLSEALRQHYFPGATTVVDVGGSNGGLLPGILAKHSHQRGLNEAALRRALNEAGFTVHSVDPLPTGHKVLNCTSAGST